MATVGDDASPHPPQLHNGRLGNDGDDNDERGRRKGQAMAGDFQAQPSMTIADGRITMPPAVSMIAIDSH